MCKYGGCWLHLHVIHFRVAGLAHDLVSVRDAFFVETPKDSSRVVQMFYIGTESTCHFFF